MGLWGFVFLAYGIVWGTILLYLYLLKQRLRRAESELFQLRSLEENKEDAKK